MNIVLLLKKRNLVLVPSVDWKLGITSAAEQDSVYPLRMDYLFPYVNLGC
jgi:hypothetical protein